MLYKIAYFIMIVSFLYLGLSASSMKQKLIGIVLAIANALIFWK